MVHNPEFVQNVVHVCTPWYSVFPLSIRAQAQRTAHIGCRPHEPRQSSLTGEVKAEIVAWTGVL